MVRCPGCGRADLSPLVRRERILEEMQLRREFFASRLDGPPDPDKQKDWIDVAHGSAAEILICRACEILARREDEHPDFEDDHYETFTMERMLRAHIDAFRAKEALYRPLLPTNAEVIEVGSYVGGFLHVAGEWGWKATGIDVGRDTARFSRAHGYATRHETLAECAFPGASLDGVFLWNCFEQLPDPHTMLDEIRRILKPDGALVVRVPNAAFYIECCARPDDPDVVAALGHANLLGFPHLYGYTPAALHKVVAAHGFIQTRLAGDRHIAPSLRPLNATSQREANRVEALVPLPPWLEATFTVATSTRS
jgi:SAM-dependent methyltransferase